MVSHLNRRSFAVGMVCAPLLAHAQTPRTFPNKVVRIVVPFPAGGATDSLARFIATKLAEIWAHPVICENKPGATGAIATEYVAKAPADAYTLLMATSTSHTVAPAVSKKVPFDNIADFAPISMLTDSPSGVLVHPSLNVRTLVELIALLKANPGKFNYASSGNGGAPHLNAELFQQLSGTRINHVPYKGDAPAVADVAAGHVQMNFGAASSALQFVATGKLRLLAVGGTRRLPTYPDVPTVQEVLPSFHASSFAGLVAPARTPPQLIATLHEDLARILATDEAKQFVTRLGMLMVVSTPQEFEKFIRADTERWRQVARKSNINLD